MPREPSLSQGCTAFMTASRIATRSGNFSRYGSVGWLRSSTLRLRQWSRCLAASWRRRS